jgi:glycosyltransferase involved in cell wall biosynthesis
MMGPQDGVDLAVRAVAAIARSGRDDVQFVFMGGGDSFDEVVALAGELGVSESITFTGSVGDDTIIEVLSTADIGLCPEPRNALNDLSTMMKTMEYMAFGLPVVAFDLKETRISAGPAAVYASPNDVDEYAQTILHLLDDRPRRESMGKLGRERVENSLGWDHQAPKYVQVYESLVSAHERQTRSKDLDRGVRHGPIG